MKKIIELDFVALRSSSKKLNSMEELPRLLGSFSALLPVQLQQQQAPPGCYPALVADGFDRDG